MMNGQRKFLTSCASEVGDFYAAKSRARLEWIYEYQEKALKTAVYPAGMKIIYPALGLAGEAGEVADKVKKIVRDKNDSDEMKRDIAAEIGDCLWYCAVLANDLGFDLAQIADGNLQKLADRQQRGVLHGSGDKR